jgi:hypothetical protein
LPLPGDGRNAEQQKGIYNRLFIEDRLADGPFEFNKAYLAFAALDAS